MFHEQVDEARLQIRKESEQYVCAKDPKAAASIEIKKSVDDRQNRCLSWCQEKESHAASCVDMVAKELQKLDEYIANIDESLFTNMDDEAPAAGARGGGSGAMGNSRSGGGGGGGGDRKRKSQGGSVDRWSWIVEGALCEVEWDGEYWQATIRKVKTKQHGGGGGGMSALRKETEVGCVVLCLVCQQSFIVFHIGTRSEFVWDP